ncbi:MAG: hypothetical protein VX642_07325 [Bdellovibrionota bacterium]|nr:hypothetical protein [Bdellovibrionota bacterium]
MYQNCDFSENSSDIDYCYNNPSVCLPKELDESKLDWEATMKTRLIFSSTEDFPKIIETEGTDYLSSSVVHEFPANQRLFFNIAHLTEHSKICVYDLNDHIDNHCLDSDGQMQPDNFYGLRESRSLHKLNWIFQQRLEKTFVDEQAYLLEFPSWQTEYDLKLGDEKVIYLYEVSSREYFGPFSFKITTPEIDILYRDENDVAGSSKEFDANEILINFTENFSDQIHMCEIILLKDYLLDDDMRCRKIENYHAIDMSQSDSLLNREDIKHNYKSWAEDLSAYNLSSGDRIYRYYLDKKWFPGNFFSEAGRKYYIRKEILIK